MYQPEVKWQKNFNKGDSVFMLWCGTYKVKIRNGENLLLSLKRPRLKSGKIKPIKMLPNKFVVSKKPKEYLVQGLSYCGAYCVKAILSAFGLDTKGYPKEYHTNTFGRLTGWTLSPRLFIC